MHRQNVIGRRCRESLSPAATFKPALDQSFHLQNSPVVDPHRSRLAVRKLRRLEFFSSSIAARFVNLAVSLPSINSPATPRICLELTTAWN